MLSTSGHGELIHRHPIADTLVHDIEPPGVMTPGTRLAACGLAPLANRHMPSSDQAAVVFPPRTNHTCSSLGRILMLLVPILSTLSCPVRHARRMVSSQHPTSPAACLTLSSRSG